MDGKMGGRGRGGVGMGGWTGRDGWGVLEGEEEGRAKLRVGVVGGDSVKLSVRNVSTFGFQMHKRPLALRARSGNFTFRGSLKGGGMERIREPE